VTTRRSAVPLDLDAALSEDGWRDGFAWPLSHVQARDLDVGPRAEFLHAIARQSDPLIQDILLHAAPHLWMNGLSLLESAYLVQEAMRRDQPLRGGPPEVFALRGLPSPEGTSHTASIDLVPEAIPNAFARRVRRTMSWTSLPGLPKAILAPDAVAVTHNSLLIAEAARDSRSIGFRHANSYLSDWAHTRVSRETIDRLAAALPDLATKFTRESRLSAELLERFHAIYPDVNRDALDNSARAVLCLRAARDIPHVLISGTGGYFPARALKIETIRRGGEALGFDHGGTAGLVEEPFASALLELSVSTRFTLPTGPLAAAVRDCAGPYPALFGGCDIAGGAGDPAFSGTPVGDARPTPAVRPKTLFVTGPFIGPRQRAQPRIHDVVKLDWHLRCAEILKRLPIDLLCQPHPEGILRGRPHPIAQVAPVSGKRFEEVAAWADVVVTDMIFSTTLWKAACLPLPIVVLDLDMGSFNKGMRDLLNRRFRFLEIPYDDHNRPVLDGAELEPLLRAPLSAEERDAAIAFQGVLSGSRP
jgi:hypothetical protein